jgi:hypothetical protein
VSGQDTASLVDQLRHRPVATTAAQMREAADTIERLLTVKRAADQLVAHIGAHGEINSRHPLTLNCLEALDASGDPS